MILFFATLENYRCHAFHVAQNTSLSLHSKSNSNITTLLRGYLSGWLMEEDTTLFLSQLQREKLSSIDKVLAWLFLMLLSSPLKCFFFIQAGISYYDIQATAKKKSLLPWIFLSGSSKVQPCHKEKAVGNQGWWSSWPTEGPWQKGQAPQYVSEVPRESVVTV